jgi:deoxyribodipyrimidine photo-lyase
MSVKAKTRVNIVWLKRDLRLTDHAPFAEAECHDLPYIIVYAFEPSLVAHEDTSSRHLSFIYHSLVEINEQLLPLNRTVLIYHEEIVNVLQSLINQFDVQNMYSHQESGINLTWKRDKVVSRFCNAHHIHWVEFQRDGIHRGIKNRSGWDKQWFATMSQKCIDPKFSKATEQLNVKNPYPLSVKLLEQLNSYPKQMQIPGSMAAQRYMHSFCEGRGIGYHWKISKPTESRESCSRLSPYLAWGNLSIRQAYQYIKAHPNFKKHKRAFGGCLTRLKWHCHFIQKFEVECKYETRHINKGYDSLPFENKESWLEAWKTGTTGFPLVDACMRCVIATGWINFRMRAMLVSFLTHHLDQDWRRGAYHLAQQFLDYEPGIHYPQFQMQAGTTGVNTVRIYNPVKQSMDHDPEGIFIKKWVPELRDMPTEYIHEPWKLTQSLFGSLNHAYPSPIINLEERGRFARKKIWGHRSNLKVKQEQQRILLTHTRRSNVTD